MKGLLLAMALQGAAADPGSLGIGIDVLPEAFSFAASRVSYAPHLALVACDRARCRWSLGAGVEMTASLTPGTLSLNRIEAEFDDRKAGGSASGASYDKACLTIVALLAPKASRSEQRSIARSIETQGALARPVRLDMPDEGYSFYGAGTAGSGGMVARCGAAMASTDIDSKL